MYNDRIASGAFISYTIPSPLFISLLFEWPLIFGVRRCRLSLLCSRMRLTMYSILTPISASARAAARDLRIARNPSGSIGSPSPTRARDAIGESSNAKRRRRTPFDLIGILTDARRTSLTTSLARAANIHMGEYYIFVVVFTSPFAVGTASRRSGNRQTVGQLKFGRQNVVINRRKELLRWSRVRSLSAAKRNGSENGLNLLLFLDWSAKLGSAPSAADRVIAPIGFVSGLAALGKLCVWACGGLRMRTTPKIRFNSARRIVSLPPDSLCNLLFFFSSLSK